MYYIQEIDKPNKILKMFNLIRLEENKIVLPIKDERITQKLAEKLADKTIKILSKTSCNKIVVSKILKNQFQYLNYLYSYDLDIVDGKWLAEKLSIKMLDYIVQKKKLKKQEMQISILCNNTTDSVIESLKIIVKQYKSVNIVTNHISKFKKIEKDILDKYGIMITVTNNKKRSLAKSKIILNYDFPSELLNKYNIYEEAIVINISGNVKIIKKRFNGLNINDYEIEFLDLNDFDYGKENKFLAKDLYEANFYKNQPFNDILKKLEKDRVKIKSLIGANTVL